MPSEGYDGLYFIVIERRKRASPEGDLICFTIDRMPADEKDVLMVLYVDLLKPSMMV